MKLIFTIIFTLNILKYSFSYECPANDKCEIWLNIEEKLTMTWDKIRVYAKDGALYKFDEHWSNATTIVSHLVNIQRRFNIIMAYRGLTDVETTSYGYWNTTFLLRFGKCDHGKINHLIYFDFGYKRHLPQEDAGHRCYA